MKIRFACEPETLDLFYPDERGHWEADLTLTECEQVKQTLTDFETVQYLLRERTKLRKK